MLENTVTPRNSNTRCLLALCLWLASLVFVLFVTRTSFAQPSRKLSELRQEYFRLRNNDTGKGLTKEWSALVADFNALMKSLPTGSAELPTVLLDSAYIEYRLWRAEMGDAHAVTASQYLDRIIEDHKKYILIDEALRLRGDIAAAFERDFKSARRYYKMMQTGAELKESRTLSLVNDTFERFAPAPELPVPDLVPSTFRKLSRKSKLVVIDPGHGGEDSGAVNGEIREKDITLAISEYLEKKLVAMGYRVHLTRNSDFFLPLIRRTEKANDMKADIFISLHSNSSPRGDGEGIESYYLDNTDDQSSRKLAERENLAGGIAQDGDDLGLMLSDLIQTGKLGDSIRLSSTIQGSLVDSLNSNWGPIANLGVKKAPFYVLVGAHMPCSLVEILFINHPADVRRLEKGAFQQDAAAAIAAGIEKYFRRESVSQSGHKRVSHSAVATKKIAKKTGKPTSARRKKK